MSFSASKGYIFYAYKYALGMGQLNNINYNNLKVYITDANFRFANSARMFGTHLNIQSDTEKYIDYANLRLKDVSADFTYRRLIPNSQGKFEYHTYSTRVTPTNMKILNTEINMFNSDTGYVSEYSYEQVKSLPASSRIFSTDPTINSNSWVTEDLEWKSTMLDNEKRNDNYFKNEYAFSEEYVKEEYDTYGLKENVLYENVVRLSAEVFTMNNKKTGNTNAMNLGVGGILLTYNDNAMFKGDNELPVAFYDLGKTMFSNYNALQIDWHDDGILKAE